MGRGRFIVIGLGLQGVGIVGLVGTPSFVAWMGGVLGVGGSVPQTAAGTIKNASSAVVLTATVLDDARFFVWLGQLIGIGFGTALSYPVLQAYIGDVVPAHHRASTIGVYRLCRDLGYAIGGLLSGYVADVYGVEQCLEMMAVLLLLSALWAFLALPKDEVEGWMTSAGGTKKEGRAERD
jgi:MFS family permease